VPTLTPTPEPTLTPDPTDVPATAIPVPTDTPAPSSYANIFISEFMANPESDNEWVELYNNNDSEVDLYGWVIDDSLTGNRIYEIKSDNKISGKSYKKYDLGSNAFLNNDGDTVRLLDGSQTEKDKKSFSSSTKGKSWSKDNDGNWCQTDPTPNSANPNCSPATSAPVATATPILTPTPIKNPTVTPQLSPTPTEKEANMTLVGETSGNPAILGAQISPTQSPVKNGGLGKFRITAGLFIFSGLILLAMAGFFLYKQKSGHSII
jgi:hypothetical protein